MSSLLPVVDRVPKTYYIDRSPVYSLIILIMVLGRRIRSLSCSPRIIASLCPLIYIPLCFHFSQLCLKRGGSMVVDTSEFWVTASPLFICMSVGLGVCVHMYMMCTCLCVGGLWLILGVFPPSLPHSSTLSFEV